MTLDVLHLLPSLSLFGGTPRKIRDLIRASPRPHGIYCWARWEPASQRAQFDAHFLEAGIPVFSAPVSRNPLAQLAALTRRVDGSAVQIVHGYFETGLMLAGAVGLLRPNVRTVASFVGHPAPQSALRRTAISILARSIDKVVYVSEFTKREYEKDHTSLKRRSSQVIYNGVQCRTSSFRSSSPDDRLRLITVSGLIGWKNVGVLLHALPLLPSTTLARTSLSIVGDGPLRSELEDLAYNLGISANVEFAGYQDDVGTYLEAADIYLHPALAEGFGIAVIEAALAGLPVIVANAGALPELVDGGECGVIANDPHDPRCWAQCIVRLAESDDLRNQLASAARERATRVFSVERFAADHETLYKQLLT